MILIFVGVSTEAFCARSNATRMVLFVVGVGMQQVSGGWYVTQPLLGISTAVFPTIMVLLV